MTDHSFGRICIEQDWRSIPLHALEDTRLDMPARVVLAWQLAHGNNWTAKIGFMRRVLKLSETRWARARDQLVAAGYLTINSFQDEATGQQCWEFIFSGRPRDEAGVKRVPPKRGYPHFPGLENPDLENSGATNSGLETRELENNNNVVVFLREAGDAGSVLNGAALAEQLGGASEEQAAWAGIAFREQVANATNPGGLATRLAQYARDGKIGKPRAVVLQEKAQKRQEADAAYRQQLRDVAASVQPPTVRRGEKLPPLPRATGGRR